MPISAAPVQAPTIAVSESGASITRHSPNSSWKPVRDLEGAAVDADVLADHEHALVAPHLLAEPVADRLQVGLHCHVPLLVSSCPDRCRASSARAARRRRRSSVAGRAAGLPRPLERVVQQLLHAGADLVVLVVASCRRRRSSQRAEALDRVALAPTPRNLLAARRRRRRGRRGPPCAASRTRAASGRRRARAFSIARLAPRGRRRARRCRRRRRPRSRSRRRGRRGARRRSSRCVGVEYAHWLLSMMKTTGSRRTPARFIASWQSPRAEAPSPNQPSAHARARSRIRKASAQPTATGSIAGRWRDHRDQRRGATSPMWTLPSRPRVGPSTRPMYCAKIAPRLDAAGDVHAHVALQRGSRRRRGPSPQATPTAARLVAAAGVERAGDLAPAGRGCARAPRCRASAACCGTCPAARPRRGRRCRRGPSLRERLLTTAMTTP